MSAPPAAAATTTPNPAATTPAVAEPVPAAAAAPPPPQPSQALQEAQVALASGANGVNFDMASVLAKLQQVEREKNELQAALNDSKHKLTKFQEEQSKKMLEQYESTIKGWLDQFKTQDEASKTQFANGLLDLAKRGEMNGVFEIAACASSNWAANVNELETLRKRVNDYETNERELMKHASGSFGSEGARIQMASSGAHDAVPGVGDKRKAEDMSTAPPANDIWGQITSMMLSEGGNTGNVGASVIY